MTSIAICDYAVYRAENCAILSMRLPRARVMLDNYSDLAIAAYPNTIYGLLEKLLPAAMLQKMRLPSNNPREWYVELQRVAMEVKPEKDFTFIKTGVTLPSQPIGALMAKTPKTDKKRSRVEQSKKIKKLVQENPRREGTHGFKSWEKIENGMSVALYLEAGGRMNDLLWEIKKKNVELI
jgi:hypothetical protein